MISDVHATSNSVLERLRGPTGSVAWRRYVELYSPLLVRWTRTWKMSDADAEDLAQDVFLQVHQKLPQYDSARGGFRGWLHTIAHHKRLEKLRREATLPPDAPLPADLADSDNVAHIAVEDHRRFLIRRCLDLLRSEWDDARYQMFLAYVLDGQPAEKVAARFDVSLDVLYATKSRILRRLREELTGPLE